jgi:Cyclic nucleotide-binding domain
VVPADPIPVFGAIRARDVRSLAGPVVQIRVAEGTELVREGAVVGVFHVIRSGSAELRSGDQTIGFLGRGDCFGESDPLEPGPQPFTVIARSPLQLLSFSAFGIDRFCAAIPGARERILAFQGRSLELLGEVRVSGAGGPSAPAPQGVGVEHGDRPMVGGNPAQLAHQAKRTRHGLTRRPRPPGELVLGQR